MWKIHRRTTLIVLSVVLAATTGPVSAADNDITAGFTLPGVTLPSGHDEVRASDGTSCRSAVSGNGSYLDIGIIGDPQDIGNGASAYGRIVIPLGRRTERINCKALYDLEVERLRTELKLMQIGLDRPVEVPELESAEAEEFDDDGWTFEGKK